MTIPESIKEQIAACRETFVTKVWLYVRALIFVGAIFGTGLGLTWGAGQWQAKTEFDIRENAKRINQVESEANIRFTKNESEIEILKRQSALVDSIWKYTKH